MTAQTSSLFRGALMRWSSVFHRISWTVIDQGLSALTNLCLSVLVARSATASGFGGFAVAFLVYGLVLGLSRALVGQPLQITFSSAAREQFRDATAHAMGAAAILGSTAALFSAGIGLAIGGPTGAALIALGLVFPALIMQDTCRMAFFAEGTPRRATAVDAVWGVAVLGGLSAAMAMGVAAHVVIPIALWGLGAGISTAYGVRLLKVRPKLQGSLQWMRDRLDFSRYLGLEYLLTMGIAQAGILMVGFVGTQAGVGAIRAAQVLLGPTNVIGTAAMTFTTTEVARRPVATARNRTLVAVGVSGALALAIGAYVSILLVLPDSVGKYLLGDTWSGAKSVLLPLCIAGLVSSVAAGPVATLYGMGHARMTFRVNVLRAALNIALFSVGIYTWGALGASWTLAITEIVLLPMWYISLWKVLRTPRGRDTPDRPVVKAGERS